MTIIFEAVYENGVLKPLEGLPFREHERVRVSAEAVERGGGSDAAPPAVDDPLADIRIATGIPDLAEHFDDYRFGHRSP